MITGRQIRAARALLGWDSAELGQKAGLRRETISNIENDTVQARETSLGDIVRVFDESGVEFTDNEGVRVKPHGVEVLTGAEGLRKFFDNVYEYARTHGGTIMMFGIDETTFVKTITPEFSQNYLKRMTDVSNARKDLEVLSIVCEGDTNFCASNYNEYRWISKDVFQAVPFYIYGETLAIMDFNTTPGPTIMLLKSRAITNAYRKQFQAFWAMAYPPQLTKKGGRK